MEYDWYITRDRQARYGPYSLEQLQDFVRTGNLEHTDLVWREGTDEWVPASTVRELFSMVPPPPPPMRIEDDQPWQQESGKKISAGVCGILLGALGVHKFILGYNVAGTIMLLVTVLTCGFGGMAMGVVGLVEGIIYLTKSDREFYKTYIAHKRDWF